MTDFTGEMVGGTGIEPVTPTMSRHSAMPNPLKNMKQLTSNFAVCSRFTPVKTGQNRAKTGRGTAVLVLMIASLATPASAGQNVWIIERPGQPSEKVDLTPIDALPDYVPKPVPKPDMGVKLSVPSNETPVDPAEVPDQTVNQ